MIRRLAVIALLLVPAISLAQRGGRTQADRKTPLFDKEEGPKGPTLRVRDIEDQSPLKLLIDKRKDLKLSDAQLSQLKDSETKLKDVNAPLYKAVDSLIRDMRNGSARNSGAAAAASGPDLNRQAAGSAIAGGLHREQLRIHAALRDELRVRPVLDRFAVLEHDDAIRHAHRREVM